MAAQQGASAPPPVYPLGAIIAYAGFYNDDPPEGWLACAGGNEAISDSTYAALYGAIGTMYGGNGTSFYLPDYRGWFLRGVDGGSGRDPDANNRGVSNPGLPIPGNSGDQVGTFEPDQFSSHTHAYTIRNIARSAQANKNGAQTIGTNGLTGPSTSTDGASDTRPINLYVYYFIRATQ